MTTPLKLQGTVFGPIDITPKLKIEYLHKKIVVRTKYKVGDLLEGVTTSSFIHSFILAIRGQTQASRQHIYKPRSKSSNISR
jgi:hypothetical protein